MKILRLSSSDIENDETDNYYMNLWDLCNFGLALLVSSIQKMILLNAKNIKFHEEIKYHD